MEFEKCNIFHSSEALSLGMVLITGWVFQYHWSYIQFVHFIPLTIPGRWRRHQEDKHSSWKCQCTDVLFWYVCTRRIQFDLTEVPSWIAQTWEVEVKCPNLIWQRRQSQAPKGGSGNFSSKRQETTTHPRHTMYIWHVVKVTTGTVRLWPLTRLSVSNVREHQKSVGVSIGFFFPGERGFECKTWWRLVERGGIRGRNCAQHSIRRHVRTLVILLSFPL